MYRNLAVAALCLLGLSACERTGYLGRMAPAPKDIMADIAPPDMQQFSYSNFWTIVMGRDAIAPRFERARDACLNDKTLNCRLIRANLVLSDGTSDYSYSTGLLQVLLPHDKLEIFEKALLQPVNGEAANDAKVQSRSTQADSIEKEVAESDRKVAGLTAYRDRLASLSKRTNLTVDEIIKLEAEVSRVQGELDQALKTKGDLESRLARESLNITLSERGRGPVTSVVYSAVDLFMSSVASVLQFLIQIIPWIPILGAGLFLAGWLWRWIRRQRLKAVPTVM